MFHRQGIFHLDQKREVERRKEVSFAEFHKKEKDGGRRGGGEEERDRVNKAEMQQTDRGECTRQRAWS